LPGGEERRLPTLDASPCPPAVPVTIFGGLMQDSRLNTISALIDDARTLIADMRDEGVPAEYRIALGRISNSLNDALRRTQNLKDAG
jgi:hypothetical protein